MTSLKVIVGPVLLQRKVGTRGMRVLIMLILLVDRPTPVLNKERLATMESVRSSQGRERHRQEEKVMTKPRAIGPQALPNSQAFAINSDGGASID